MKVKCPLKIGALYKTKTQTMLFDKKYNVVSIKPNEILLLINSVYNKAENMWCLDFIYQDKILKACNRLVCTDLKLYFAQIVTK